jgi:L-ribulokinase
VPLALHEKCEGQTSPRSAALWKDHTGYREAARITDALAAQHRAQFIAKRGNACSSEWFWSEIWKCSISGARGVRGRV